MALPISVGDVIDIARAVVGIYERFCRANKDMSAAIERAKYAQTLFEPFKSPEQQPSFLRTPDRKELNQVFTKEIEKLMTTLRELEKIVTKWRKVSPVFHRRFYFILFEIPDVVHLKEDLKEEMENIAMIFTINQWRDRGVKVGPEQMKKVCTVAAKPVYKPSISHGQKDPSREAVKDAFKRSGITAQTPSLDENRKQKLRENLAMIPGAEKIVAIYDHESREPTAVLSRPPVSPKPYSGLQPARKIDILIVDTYNGRRSIMAQTYLELMGVWAANKGEPWFFRRVDSAGIHVKSTLWESRTGKPISGAPSLQHPGELVTADVVDSMVDMPGYFTSNTKPEDKQRIMDRMKAHKRQGIEPRMFLQNQYILTFSDSMRATLEQLCSRAQKANPEAFGNKPLPKLLLLPNTKAEILRPPAKDIVKPIRGAVQEFLVTKFEWTRPWTRPKN